jgi:hypothetical protein
VDEELTRKLAIAQHVTVIEFDKTLRTTDASKCFSDILVC